MISPSESTQYNYSNPGVIISPGNKKIQLPSEDKKFNLTKEVFDKIHKVSGVMKLKEILIDKKGIKIFNTNSVGNSHTINISYEFCSQKPVILKVENLKFIPVDYAVSIDDNGIAKFTSKSEEYRVEYFVTLEAE
jgi:hypothetical protein